MSLEPSLHARLVQELGRRDRMREGPETLLQGAQHTEWQHFIILAESATIVANLSFSTSLSTGELVPRMMLAVHRKGWRATIQEFPLSVCDLRAGRVDVRLGESSVRLCDGGYQLLADSRGVPGASAGGMRMKLSLIPEAPVVFARDARLGPGSLLSWLAIPRLRAVGVVEVDGEQLQVRGSPAYHDHNWGTFDWGGDFAWDWSVALPVAQGAWCFLVYRILDRARSTVRQQGVWVWRDSRLVGVFRDDQVRFTEAGFHRRLGSLTLPVQLDSLVPPAAAFPRTFSFESESKTGRLRGTFESEDVLRIVAPGAAQVSVLNELSGTMTLTGELSGERLDLSSPGLLEIANA